MAYRLVCCYISHTRTQTHHLCINKEVSQLQRDLTRVGIVCTSFQIDTLSVTEHNGHVYILHILCQLWIFDEFNNTAIALASVPNIEEARRRRRKKTSENLSINSHIFWPLRLTFVSIIIQAQAFSHI